MPSFKIIGNSVLEKKVFTIYGHGSHLGHLTCTIYANFRSPFLRMLHINLAFIGQAVSEKMFEIVDDHDHDDGRRSMGILSAHLVSLKAQMSQKLQIDKRQCEQMATRVGIYFPNSGHSEAETELKV